MGLYYIDCLSTHSVIRLIVNDQVIHDGELKQWQTYRHWLDWDWINDWLSLTSLSLMEMLSSFFSIYFLCKKSVVSSWCLHIAYYRAHLFILWNLIETVSMGYLFGFALLKGWSCSNFLFFSEIEWMNFNLLIQGLYACMFFQMPVNKCLLLLIATFVALATAVPKQRVIDKVSWIVSMSLYLSLSLCLFPLLSPSSLSLLLLPPPLSLSLFLFAFISVSPGTVECKLLLVVLFCLLH